MKWFMVNFCILSVSHSLWAQLPPASFYQLRRDERLMSSFYHCLAEDEYGFIWFGSRHGGGLYRYDGYDLRPFVIDPSQLHQSLCSNEINTVYSYGDGNIYVGSYGGMTVLNLVTGVMRCYADDIGKVPDHTAFYVEPIIPDSFYRCTWIGGAHGLFALYWDTDSLVNLLPIDESNRVPPPKGIIDMLVDHENENILWLGTVNGLFSYDKNLDQYKYHPYPQEEKIVIMDLHQDVGGTLWIAGDSHEEGSRSKLMSYSVRNYFWKEYKLLVKGNRPKEYLGEVYFILPAVLDNFLWISTRSSTGMLNTQTSVYEAWTFDPDKPDGLLPNEFFRSMLADRHGRLWISSWQGIQYAKKAFVLPGKSNFRPKVSITEVIVSNARTDMPMPLLYHEALQLEDDQREISIRYVLPNPLNTSAVLYQYQLKGRDKDWVTTDQRLIPYSNLRGGNYTFLVRGREGDQDWGDITALEFSVEKKLTEYVTFWIFISLLAGAMIIGINRFLISRTRKEEQLKTDFNKKVSQVEMQALRAQMNPHFLFNSLNAIKYYALSKDKDATAEYLTKFSMLVRAILNNSKAQTISLKDELEALRLYIEIEHLRLEGKFDYHIDIDSGIHVDQILIPPMILQPFVENAIWHGLMHKGSGGKLLIQVRDMGTHVQCVIEDNGIGRAKAREIRENGSGHKKSLGMQITGDRIAMINSIYGIDTQVHVIDLLNAKGEAEGTRVVINIPLINDENEYV